ncbi:hypothetical protein Vretifemale_17174 [Volvox reticuliferus]|uniref:Phosphoglycerate mutase n=1 Tax=Volvox reticuliferus TaxID=1737510 RepID=A0A8J4CZ41_9CHLO|nr:hypothetical protein Vretifemale_17174 [Volvox reticuliferus]
MASHAHRYLLVMRHAQRQDEVDEGWTVAAAARPGGRPWDPPLSSPHGLAQAEEAMEKLVAWSQRTGAHIVAVVTSPFFRCLQTAAAACRRLGLRQLHVSWAISEALCRISDAPTGPLPDWMWPRVRGNSKLQPWIESSSSSSSNNNNSVNDGDDCSCSRNKTRALFPEEFLMELGAVVVAAPEESVSCLKELQPVMDQGARAQRGGGEEARNAGNADADMGEGMEDQQHRTDASPKVLKGLVVTVLPPPVDPTAPGGDRNVPTEPGMASALDGSDPADSVMQLTAAGGESGYAAESAISAGLPHVPSGATRDEAAYAQIAAEAQDIFPGDLCFVGPQQCEHLAHQPQDGELPFDKDEHPAVQAAGQVYCVPYSPESLEAAHVRYRAVLRCLMATAAITPDAATTHPLDADRTQGHPGNVDAGPACTTSLRHDEQKELRPWQALWRAGTLQSVGDAAATPTDDHVAGNILSLRTPSTAEKKPEGIRESGDDGGVHGLPGPAQGTMAGGTEATSRAQAATIAAGHHGDNTKSDVTCCRGNLDNGDEDSPRQPLERSANQLEPPPHGHTSPARQRRGQEQEQQPQQHTAKAVLVVTHGEAVACAATMVAPFVLVYEVRHTGFVVLESMWNEEGGEQHASGKAGFWEQSEADGSSDAAWELVPDPDGNHGVLWMSGVDD